MGKSKASKKRAKEKEVNAAEVAMAAAVQRLQGIFREHSEQEIRAALLECNMNQTFAINRLLSQQDASSEQGASTQMRDSSTSSVLVPNQSDLPNVPVSSGEAVPLSSEPSSTSAITNGETRTVPISSTAAVPSFSVPSSSDVTTNDETKSVPVSSTVAVLSLPVPSTSNVTNGETRSVPISSNVAVPPFSLPSSSDITNGETKSVTISSNVAVPSLSVPSSRPLLAKVKPKRQESRMISATGPPMAEVLWGLHGPSKQNVTKAPVKADDSPLKPDATNPIFSSNTESDAARDPQHSAFPMATRQSIASASLLGPRPMTSMFTDAFGTYPTFEPHNNNQHGMNSKSITESDLAARDPQHSAFPVNQLPMDTRQQSTSSQLGLFSSADFQLCTTGSNSYTLAHDGGDMMNPHYLWRHQAQNNNVPSSSSALQQRRGGNDTSIYESLNSVFAQYRNTTLSPSATSTVPSSHRFDMTSGNAANSRWGYEDVSRNQFPSNLSGGGASIGLSSRGSAFGFDMTSGNDENLRWGYEDVSRSHFPSNPMDPSSHVNGSNSRFGYGDYSLPPVYDHQGRSPFEWRVQEEYSYGSTRPRSQQEREAYFERIRADLLASSLDQEYNRRYPSDQTQQRPRDK